MRLAAVVRLVVEKMIERRGQHLLNVLGVDDSSIPDRFRQIGVGQSGDEPCDACIFPAAS